MTPLLKKHGAAIIWVVTAIAIVAAAWFGKDTEYENAFLYILGAGAILSGVFEVYASMKDKDKR